MRRTIDQQLIISAFMVITIGLCVMEVFFIRNPFTFTLSVLCFCAIVSMYFLVTPGLRMFVVCAWLRDWKCCGRLVVQFMTPDDTKYTGFPKRKGSRQLNAGSMSTR